MDLYHYYDRRTGPFKSLSALPPEEASRILEKIRTERPDSFCAQRDDSYVSKRRRCEEILRREFKAIGGIMDIDPPHYMVIGECPWLGSWYEQSEFIKIPVEELDTSKISFTYGDSMPTFNYDDGREYRKKVYSYDGILKMIDKYGLPQDWNDDGRHGPERYIEAHVWSDDVLRFIIK